MAATLAVVVALASGLFAALGPAPAASAALNGVTPADENGFPTYEFTSADALFVYTLSDTKGGRVCIVPAEVTDPAAG